MYPIQCIIIQPCTSVMRKRKVKNACAFEQIDQTASMPSLKALLELDDKTPIGSVRGVIESVYKERTGTNSKGEWTVQDVRFRDGDTECYVSVWNYKGDLEKLTGKTVELCAKKGQKGLSGLYIEEGQNNKKKLKLTDSGSIKVLGDEDSASPAKGETHVDYDNKKPSPKARLYQAAQCYVDCVGAANLIRKEMQAKHELGMTPEHFQAVCSSLFIFADKNHLVSLYPTHPPKDDKE